MAFFPLVVLAVIVTVPAATPVSFPPETEAILELDESQVTVCDALAGLTVAVSVADFPLAIVSEVELKLTEVALGRVTVTVQAAFFPLEVWAVITAVPAATAVTFPPETVATLVLLEVQATL